MGFIVVLAEDQLVFTGGQIKILSQLGTRQNRPDSCSTCPVPSTQKNPSIPTGHSKSLTSRENLKHKLHKHLWFCSSCVLHTQPGICGEINWFQLVVI